MEVIKDPEIVSDKTADKVTDENTVTNISSFSLGSLPDNEPQQINISKVTDHSSGNEVPVDLDQLVIDENGYVQMVKRELRVSVDHISGNTVVSVIDGYTRDVVRYIPQDEVLAVERLITAPAGMLFRTYA